MDLDTLYYGDCLDWMARWPGDSVDLVYLDPPFNSNANYNVLFANDDPRGRARLRAFSDTWRWDEDAVARYRRIADGLARPSQRAVTALYGALGDSGMMAYIAYMAERLEEMLRLLKPTGAIYCHCNRAASHYIKIVMDRIFGARNMIEEIVWNYGTPSGGRVSGKKPVKTHDVLLAYAMNYGDHCYNIHYTPYNDKYIREWFRREDENGRKYQTRLRDGQVMRQYLDESPGIPLSTVWSDIMQIYGSRGWFPTTKNESLGYPTQKPLALLKRVVGIGSNPGDIVLDPFCGCGTTVEAAHRLKRRWIGVDISAFAIDLIRKRRLKDENIATQGLPQDMVSARKLARERPFDFESWAVMRLPGFAPNIRQRGDGGIDGRGTLAVQPDNHPSKIAVAQVKSGKFALEQFRAFAGAMEQAGRAALGIFITLDEVTSPTARREAGAMGEVAIQATRYPRMQLWSIADWFEGRPPQLPPDDRPTHRQTPAPARSVLSAGALPIRAPLARVSHGKPRRPVQAAAACRERAFGGVDSEIAVADGACGG